MANKKLNKIIQGSQDRADLIAELFERFEQLVDNAGAQLTEDVIQHFMDVLTTENGIVLNDADNLRKVAIIDKAWENFQSQHGLSIVSNLVTDLSAITDANLKYYRTLSDTNIKGDDIRNIINERLGLVEDKDGNLTPKKAGYMKGLMDDESVRNEIKQFAYKQITTGAGYNDMLKNMRDFIQGDGAGNLGAFKQFHRNFTFDTYTQIDRLNGALHKEKQKLKYFIFQGTKRTGSRYFCSKRKGQVFSEEEAEGWKDMIGEFITVPGKKEGTTRKVLTGPIVEDKATYSPVIDMGGIGCEDVPSWISEEIAFAMRPDLKNKKIQVSEDYKKQHEGENGANVYVHDSADKDSLDYNIKYSKKLADNGESVKIRKHVNTQGIKNPELQFADGVIGDFKEPKPDKSLKTSVQSALKQSNKQGAARAVIILKKNTYNKHDIIRALNGSLSKGKNTGVNDVWVMIQDELIKISRNDIKSKDYYDRLPE